MPSDRERSLRRLAQNIALYTLGALAAGVFFAVWTAVSEMGTSWSAAGTFLLYVLPVAAFAAVIDWLEDERRLSAAPDEQALRAILRAASRSPERPARLTAADLLCRTRLTTDAVEAALEELVRRGYCDVEVESPVDVTVTTYRFDCFAAAPPRDESPRQIAMMRRASQ
jgi:hypothetical protein